jgi:molecular chaperone IbpA
MNKKYPNNFDKIAFGFDRLFDEINHMERHKCNLPYNIVKHHDGRLSLEIAFSGYKKEDISVELVGDKLKISANKTGKIRDGDTFIHRGISAGVVNTSFLIGDGFEVDGATLQDGVLIVSMAKISQHDEVKKIDIL